MADISKHVYRIGRVENETMLAITRRKLQSTTSQPIAMYLNLAY